MISRREVLIFTLTVVPRAPGSDDANSISSLSNSRGKSRKAGFLRRADTGKSRAYLDFPEPPDKFYGLSAPKTTMLFSAIAFAACFGQSMSIVPAGMGFILMATTALTQ